MPQPIIVPAMTIDEVCQYTQPSLEWCYAYRTRDWASMWMDIPDRQGVYAWVARPSEAVIYIGCATGRHGLRKRLADQFGWIHDAEAAAARNSNVPAHHHPGHSRTVLAMDGSVYWALTDTAAEWERRLLHLSLRLTGIVPIINGGAWTAHGEAADDARLWVDSVLDEPTAKQAMINT